MAYSWVPMFGEFDITPDLITFRGRSVEQPTPATPATPAGPDERTAPQVVPPIGTVLANKAVTNGVVRADVRFTANAVESACEIIIGYDVETRGQLSAGITGFTWAAYAIREWISGKAEAGSASEPRWQTYDATGDRRNLDDDVWYALEVRLAGSRVTLHVDGVHVATAKLPRAHNQPRQVGLWCMGNSDIEIRNFVVDAEKPKAFIVMQFSSPYDEVYSEVIREACRQFDIDALRADELYTPGLIIRDVTEKIIQAQLVIADITPENANVYFEVGYALALNKPIILLAAKGTKLPFDVSGFRVLFYEDSIGGKTKLEHGLQQHLNAILGS